MLIVFATKMFPAYTFSDFACGASAVTVRGFGLRAGLYEFFVSFDMVCVVLSSAQRSHLMLFIIVTSVLAQLSCASHWSRLSCCLPVVFGSPLY